MKILIADKFQKDYLGAIQAMGHEITLNPDLSAEELPSVIKGYECLIVRGTKVTARTIEASDALSLIIRAGAGVNTIDIDAAAKKAIFVTNTPGKNALAVAELAFGLMLAIDRRIPDNVNDLRNSVWNKKKYSSADGIYGKTVGIIGMGEIGIAFAERAKAFGMTVIAFDPIAIISINPKILNRLANGVFSFVSTTEELTKRSDIITFHVPSNPHTKRMINKDFLKNVKENAILINTSRGDIVDDEALIEAINTKNLRVGLDVFNNEPAEAEGTFDSALSKHPSVYGTHHIGASTEQSQNAIAAEVVKILKGYESGNVMYASNIEMKPVTKHTLVLRVFDKVGVLASILELLKSQGVSIQQMDSKVFNGEITQQIVLHLSKCPDEKCVEAIGKISEVIQVSLKSIVSDN